MNNTTHYIAKLKKMEGHLVHRTAPVFWGGIARDDTYMDMRIMLVKVGKKGVYVRMPEYFGYSALESLELKYIDGNWETADDWPNDWSPNVEKRRVG